MEPNSSEAVSEIDSHESVAAYKSEPTELINRSDISSSTSQLGKDECYLTLAQVNLLRIRKQTPAAVELCETALAKWPFRADAHALLGDLYQELGRLDDAILRYCRVLELDPKSKVNRQKLSDTVRLKRAQIGPVSAPKQKGTGLRLDRFVRAVILFLATMMLLTIMVTPVIFERRKDNANSAPITIDKRINLNPILLQPLQPTQVPTGGDQQPAQPLAIIRDPAEQALVDLMGNDKLLLQQGLQVLDAQEDPVTNGFSITYLERPADTTPVSKLDILRNSLVVARSASDRFGSRDVRQFTIRCLLLSSTTTNIPAGTTAPIAGTTTLAFVGTLQRSAVPQSGSTIDSSTADQLLTYFTNPWWGSGIN